MSRKERVRTRDVMQTSFTEIEGLATVREAVDLMRETGSRVLIVKKRDDMDEYGMVLLSDIGEQILAKDRAPERVNVYEIMSKPVVGVDPHMDIRYCARLFARLGLSVMPVLEDEQVIGTVSYHELVLGGL